MKYLIKQVYNQIKNNWQAIFGALVVVSGSLFVLLAFIILLKAFVGISFNYFNQHFYSIILTSDASNDQIDQLKKYINQITNDQSINFISSEQLTQGLEKELNISNLPLSDQIFGGSLEFNISQPTNSQQIALDSLSTNQIVESIITNKGINKELNSFLKKSQYFFGFLVFFVAIGLFLTIYVVVQLIVYTYSRDIKIMSILGASNFFIIKPFLLTSQFIALISYVIAIFCSYLVFIIIFDFSSESSLLYFLPKNINYFQQNELVIGICLIMILCLIASLLACNKVLKRIESWN